VPTPRQPPSFPGPPPDGGGHGDRGNRFVGPVVAAWGFVRHDPAALAAVPPLAAWDAVRQPDQAWAEIDESRVRWLTQIVLIPFVGAWRYASTVRPRLEGASIGLWLRGG
jgi:hypothetical protein